MLITYILALASTAILLFGAVQLHLCFALHRSAKVKVKVAVHHVRRTSHLHEQIFRKF
jgi:hypothetical protein